MAGATLERKLTDTQTGRVRFALASKGDDADIRRLLRETPMAGQVAISLEREPYYFADAGIAGETRQTIVARDGGRLVCAGSCTIRKRFVNGAPHRVGYLGGLRLDERHAGRFDILRRGYEFFCTLQSETPADFYFTSIAADNERARNFLERGIKGMPRYEFAGEYVTMLIPTAHRGSRNSDHCRNFASDDAMPELDELIPLLNNSNKRCQFAPCWSASELCAFERLGLRASDFRIIVKNEKPIACGALWDQRGFKQTVIRGYAPWLKLARPVVNGLNRLMSGSRLPVVGEMLASAFASNLAFDSEGTDELLDLIRIFQQTAHQRKIEFLALGLAANDARLAVAQKNFPSREYRSRLYVVRWPGIGGSLTALDGRKIAPEVALL